VLLRKFFSLLLPHPNPSPWWEGLSETSIIYFNHLTPFQLKVFLKNKSFNTNNVIICQNVCQVPDAPPTCGRVWDGA